MAILNIFSPGWLNGDTATQFLPNPWGTSDVWVQCTVPALQVNQSLCLGGFGIIEVVSLDGQGNPQVQQFGNPGDLNSVVPENLVPRLYVPRMLSVTLAHIVADLRSSGTVTLFQWG